MSAELEIYEKFGLAGLGLLIGGWASRLLYGNLREQVASLRRDLEAERARCDAALKDRDNRIDRLDQLVREALTHRARSLHDRRED